MTHALVMELVEGDDLSHRFKVRDDGTVKVLDFGLAKALDQPGPTWSPDGTRLYYRTGRYDRHTVMEVDVRIAGNTFAVGTPRELFTAAYGGTVPHRRYDVFADGTFAMYADRTAEPQPVHDIQLMLGLRRAIDALLAGRE